MRMLNIIRTSQRTAGTPTEVSPDRILHVRLVTIRGYLHSK